MSEKKHVVTVAEMLEGMQKDEKERVVPAEIDETSEGRPVEEQDSTWTETESVPEDAQNSAAGESAPDAPSAEAIGETKSKNFRTRPWIMPEPPEDVDPAIAESNEENSSESPEEVDTQDVDACEQSTDTAILTVPSSAEDAMIDDAETDEDVSDEENGERPVVLISHLSKKIAGQPVLNDINLALFNGHVLGLLGPNGSGKTTLLRILAGLAHPSAGRVEIDGITPGTETKSLVSYLPDTLFLGPEMTVESARRYFQTFFLDFDRDRFDELSERLALLARTKVSKMSKGYRDRLAVALVMSRRARLYLLDEPLGGVDPVVRDQILDILVEALGDEATMLITTHQVRDLERVFDEVCFLREGQVARYGVAEEIRRKEQADLDHVYRAIFG